MIRFALSILLVALTPQLSVAEFECELQDYDSEVAPDFDCPGPDERILVPDIDFHGSVPLEVGEEFTPEWPGAFVDVDRLVQMGMILKASRRLRWADRRRLRLQYEIELEYNMSLAQAQIDYMTDQRDNYRQQLNTANDRIKDSNSWWRSPVLWFAVGVVATVGLVALSAYGLSAVGG